METDRLRTFLFQYRITPQSVTGKFPAELLMNRKLNNRLNITKPDADSSEVSYPRNSGSFETDEDVCVRTLIYGKIGFPVVL